MMRKKKMNNRNREENNDKLVWPSIPYDLFSCVFSGNYKKVISLLEKNYYFLCEQQMENDNQAAHLFYNTLILTFYEACKGGLDVTVAAQLYHQFASNYLEANTSTDRFHLLLKMVEQYTLKVQKSKKESNYSLVVQYCISYIFEHIDEPLKVSTLAKECKVSVSTLRRHFIKEFGSSPNQFIAKEKIRRAAFLLRTTELTNTEISYNLGFCTQSYFIEQFKKITGITPSKYRVSEVSSERVSGFV